MRDYFLSFIWAPLLIAQIVLVFIFGTVNPARLTWLVYTGYVIWLISAIFGWWPIFALKKQGGVAKRTSYVHTTTLVTTGLYSVIRHPQYTAGILFGVAIALVSQHIIVIALGVAVVLVLYIDIMRADKHEIEKFGDEYVRYLKKVPRTNFLLGIARRLLASEKTSREQI